MSEHKTPEIHEGYRIVQRSLLKSLGIVLVVTFSMIINVRVLLQIFGFFVAEFSADRQYYICIHRPTNDWEGI